MTPLIINICLAAVAALAAQLLPLTQMTAVPPSSRPNFTDLVYYLPYVFNPLVAGFIAYLYFHATPSDNYFLVAQVGISAPFILQNFIANPIKAATNPQGTIKTVTDSKGTT
ncbi:hypothetical protein [Hymenobacter terrigena]